MPLPWAIWVQLGMRIKRDRQRWLLFSSQWKYIQKVLKVNIYDSKALNGTCRKDHDELVVWVVYLMCQHVGHSCMFWFLRDQILFLLLVWLTYSHLILVKHIDMLWNPLCKIWKEPSLIAYVMEKVLKIAWFLWFINSRCRWYTQI